MCFRTRANCIAHLRHFWAVGAILTAFMTSAVAEYTADVTVTSFRMSSIGQPPGSLGYLFPYRRQTISGGATLDGQSDYDEATGWFAPLTSSVTTANGSASMSQGSQQWNAHAELVEGTPRNTRTYAYFRDDSGPVTWTSLRLAPHTTLQVSIDYTISGIGQLCDPGSVCSRSTSTIVLSGQTLAGNTRDSNTLDLGGTTGPAFGHRSGTLQILLSNPDDQWGFAGIQLHGDAQVNTLLFPIPEPSTLALFLVGLATLVGLRRRGNTI